MLKTCWKKWATVSSAIERATSVTKRLSDSLAYRTQALTGLNQRADVNTAATNALLKEQFCDGRAVELAKLCVSERGKVKDDIEALATDMLKALFGDHYSFEFQAVIDKKDGTLTGLRPLVFEYDDGDDPAEFGGGVCNITSLAIRTVFVLLKQELTPVLILDEPNTNLDAEKWDAWVAFMQDLCKDVDLQIIAVTHSDALFPTTYRVTKPSKRSIVERV